MTKQFRTIQETKANNDFGQLFSDQIYNATLTQNTATTLTVPGGGIMGTITSYGESNNKNNMMAVIRVNYGNTVFVTVNKTAAAPAGASFASATSEIVTSDNPRSIPVAVGDVMSFFSTLTTTSVSVSFYALAS